MMFEITWLQDDGQQRVVRAAAPLEIGRDAACGLRLPGWRVARRHARLCRHDAGVSIEDLGTLGGTWLNGRRVVHHGSVQPHDEITIGGHRLQVCWLDEGGTGQAMSGMPAGQSPTAHVHADPQGMRDRPGNPAVSAVVSSPGGGPEAALGTGLAGPDPDAPMGAPAGAPLAAASASAAHEPVMGRDPPAADALRVAWRRRLHARLLEAMELRRRDVASMSDAALRGEADALVADLIAAAEPELPAALDRAALRREVVDEAVGLGPLEALLADASVSEIMVNRHDEVYVERRGVLSRHPVGFSSERAVLGVIERIVAPLGRRIDESSPMVDARLPDGSRVNAVIPPVALHGAALTIRKFPAQRLQAADLVRTGALDDAMVAFLALCVRERRNIVVSGGTGAGKTTLLNILSNFVPTAERIVTIEDAAELRLHHPHRVALEARPPNAEGRGAITIRDLVRNALRMRPDRIVVGECRGPEALDMLQAMNTGHAGSLTTVHANTARDALARLETLVLMAGVDLPLGAVRDQIASSIDIIVQQSRDAHGVRRVVAIVEVSGVESGRIQLQDLFRFDAGPGGGAFVGAGLLPSGFEDWHARGLVQSETFFGRTPVQEGWRAAPHAP